VTALVAGPKTNLVIENLALRQQLAIFKAKQPKPHLSNADRLFWVTLRRLWAGWANALIIVKPETVVRWHRQGFRHFWRWKSTRNKRPGRPTVSKELRDLIRKMARENTT